MEIAAFSVALLAASASAFAPAQQGSRAITFLHAEKSVALPFMNRPKLVSQFISFALHSIDLYCRVKVDWNIFML
jgi:hypothetical protein